MLPLTSALASFLVFLPARQGPGAAPPDAARPLALIGGTLLASPEAEPLSDAIVRIERGEIVAVGRADELALLAGAEPLSAAGLYLVAGFQNSHVHFSEPHRWSDAGTAPAAELQRELDDMFLRFGFVSVVDTGSALENTLALRRRIESGELAGPRILTAGGPLYPREGIPYYLRESLPAEVLRFLATPASASEARERIVQQLDAGADLVKIFSGSWVERGRVQPMDEEVAVGAVAAAHARGKLVFSHASDVASLELALLAGVDVLAHALDDARGLEPGHLEDLKNAGMALIPTLTLLEGAQPALRQVRDFAALGGTILFGTDVGFLPDPDPAREYELLAAAGLDGRALLRALTSAPAETFGQAGRRGRLIPGMQADLVALGSDPLVETSAFADVRWVLRGGQRVYTRP